MLTKADRTKQFIIEKAAPIFNKKGYAGTSIFDIMEATGLAKGGIYGNFKDKDEIASLVFDYSMNIIRTQIAMKTRQQNTALGKLTAILAFYKNYALDPSIEGGCVLMNTAIESDDALPFLKKKAQQALNDMLAALEHYFTKGVENGEFRKNIDPKEEAELFYAQIEGGIMMSKLMDDQKVLNNLLERMRIYLTEDLKP